MLSMKIGFLISISMWLLVDSAIEGSNVCYRHTLASELTVAGHREQAIVSPLPVLTIFVDRVPYSFTFIPSLQCRTTFRVRYPTSGVGQHSPSVSLKMHPSSNTLDDYLLTFDGQNGDSVYRLSGFDPTFSLFFEVLGNNSQILPSSELQNLSPDQPQLMGRVDVSLRNDPFCAVIIDKDKRHVLTVQGTRRSEVYSYFEFHITSTLRTGIIDNRRGFRELKLSGYMMRCPPTHRGSENPTVTVVLEDFCFNCFVDVYLRQVVDGELGRFAQASYRQVEEAVRKDGKRSIGGTISLPNLVLRRYSSDIAHQVSDPGYLPLLSVTPDPDRHCTFGNWRLAIREQFHGSRRISLITRAEKIRQRPGSVVVSERSSPELLNACHVVIGDGVKQNA